MSSTRRRRAATRRRADAHRRIYGAARPQRRRQEPACEGKDARDAALAAAYAPLQEWEAEVIRAGHHLTQGAGR